MIFIFVHSAMPGEVSGSESQYFAEILASITGIGIDTAQFIVRKAAHFTEYTILGICLAVNFNDLRLICHRDKTEGAGEETCADKTTPKQPHSFMMMIAKHPMLAAWITGSLYAATDEFHQLFVANRSGELRDVCIDSAGVLLGTLVYRIYSKIRD